MSSNIPGPREQALANQRAEQFNDIPGFLDRVQGMTQEQINASAARARKAAGKPRKAREFSAPTRDSNLTDTDRANIAALKKAGADRVSIIKQVGAKVKTQETDMAKKTKTKKASQAKARTPVKDATEAGVRPGSKLEIIVGLLKQEKGTTTKEILAKTGWPAVSVPQQARAAGLTLAKEKVDGVTVYRAA